MKKHLLFVLLMALTCQHLQGQGIDFTYTLNFQVKNGDGQIVENGAGIWIPDMDRDIRGLVLSSMIRNEFEFNKDPDIRAACAEQNLALVFFYGAEQGDYYSGGSMSVFNPQLGHDTVFNSVLRRFAELSGKTEVRHAPWLAFGHSTGIAFCRNLAWWHPEKTFGVIHYKTGGISAPPWADPEASIRGIPWLALSAWWDKYANPIDQSWKDSRAEVLSWRKKGLLISHITEPLEEEGHSIWRTFDGPYFAAFISKAARTRIPWDTVAKSGPVPLRHVPEEQGALSTSDTEPIMRYGFLTDDMVHLFEDVNETKRDDMFWHIDEEMAVRWVNYESMFFDPFEPEGDTLAEGLFRTWNRGQRFGSGSYLDQGLSLQIHDLSGDSLRTGQHCEVYGTGDFRVRSTFPLLEAECQLSEDDGLQSFVNAADALLIHRIASGDASFTPDVFQISAADVNMDQVVSEADLIQVLDRAVGNIGDFHQESSEQPVDMVFMDSLWNKFNPKTRLSASYPEDDGSGFSSHRTPGLSQIVTLPYRPGHPYPEYKQIQIYAVALGDVDGSLDRMDQAVSETDSLIFEDALETEIPGQYEIAVTYAGTENIAAVDLCFDMLGHVTKASGEPWQLQAVSADPGSLLRFRQEELTAWISLMDPNGFSDGDTVCKLLIDSQEGLPDNFYIHRGLADGSPVSVDAPQNTGGMEDPESGRLLYPNPVGDQLRISLARPVTAGCHIRLMDLQGRVFLEEEVQVPSREIFLQTDQLRSGVYLLQVESTELSFSSRFIKR